ncbi:putative zinc-binding protein [Pseudomonas beijingensis]|uniref:putative zinc-binding protein n=1 Tax=Pseudomonas beijingensis TaxID=2954101 RepID=UPI00273555D4|nr:putative zinc-binding protein [Pseudomonas sp. FP2262]WLH48763.1 putative zinc-binding protein [Pseudomonas sp. FP2262]
MSDSSLPLVYSCSGCSNVAQLANTLALRLDRSGLAEMSCIVGVGGHVAALVNKARSGRRILALDGCPLQCVESCLNQHDLHADVHLIVSRHGLRKRNGEDCTEEQSDELFEEIKRLIESQMIEATERA